MCHIVSILNLIVFYKKIHQKSQRYLTLEQSMVSERSIDRKWARSQQITIIYVATVKGSIHTPSLKFYCDSLEEIASQQSLMGDTEAINNVIKAVRCQFCYSF